MAKKKGKKKAADDSAKPNKAEIREYYAENGWRATVSHFGIAPKDLSPIVMGKKGKKTAAPKRKAPKKPGKKKTPKKAAAPKKKKKGAKKKAAKGKSAEAPYGYKKDGTPKKPPGRKTGKKAAKKAAAPKKKKAAKKAASRRAPTTTPTNDARNIVLDFLLAYRKKNQKPGHMVPLDSVVIDLTAKLRGV